MWLYLIIFLAVIGWWNFSKRVESHGPYSYPVGSMGDRYIKIEKESFTPSFNYREPRDIRNKGIPY